MDVCAETFFSFPFAIFRVMLFDFESPEEKSTLKKFVHLGRCFYVLLCIFTIFLGVLSILGYAIEHWDEPVHAAIALMDSLNIIVILAKGATAFIWRNEIWEIFKELKETFDDRVNMDRRHGVKKHLDGYNFFVRMYATTIILLFMPASFLIIPYLIDGTMELTITYWFPFEVFTIERFPIAIAWTAWTSWVLLTFSLATDCLLYALVAVISMGFEILSVDLMNFNETPLDERHERLKHLINRHNRLYYLSEKLQDIYSVNLLLIFAVNSIIIGFSLLRDTISKDDFSSKVFNAFFFAMKAEETFLLCTFGQKLMDASESVIDGVYTCGWEDFESFNNSFRKECSLMMQRAQKTMRLTAMGFADISYVTLSAVSSSFAFSE